MDVRVYNKDGNLDKIYRKLNLNDHTKVEEKFRDISSDQIIRIAVIDENTIIG